VGFDYFGERFTAACMATGTSSFADFLTASAPQLLPGAPAARQAAGQGAGPDVQHGMLPARDHDRRGRLRRWRHHGR
jgi:hypothetical protein